MGTLSPPGSDLSSRGSFPTGVGYEWGIFGISGLRTLSERTKRYIEVIVLVVFGFFTAAMICDYTQLSVSYVI